MALHGGDILLESKPGEARASLSAFPRAAPFEQHVRTLRRRARGTVTPPDAPRQRPDAVPDFNASAFDRLGPAADPLRELAHGRTSASRLILRALWRNPLRSAAWLGIGGVGLAVFANLLLFQPERHRSRCSSARRRSMWRRCRRRAAAAEPGAEREAEEMRRVELLRDIQVELQRRGLFQGEVDGAAGPRTAKAIRDAQAQLGLPVTGEASDALLAALLTSPVSTGAVSPAARPRDQIANLLKASPDRFERPATVAAVQRALGGSDTGRSRTTASSAPAHAPPSTVSSATASCPPRREPEPRSARTVAGLRNRHRLAGRCGAKPPPMSRLRSDIFVAAYVRRRNGENALRVVRKRGAAEAGAIFICIDRRDGTVDLYGPAPQTAFDDARRSACSSA